MLDQSHISQMKVELLETIAVWLTSREVLRRPDPLAAAANLEETMRDKIKKRAASLPQDAETNIAQIAGLELTDSFFDRVRAEMQAPQKDSDPT